MSAHPKETVHKVETITTESTHRKGMARTVRKHPMTQQIFGSVIGFLILVFVIVFVFGQCDNKDSTENASTSKTSNSGQPVDKPLPPEFPPSGEDRVTSSGLKVWLDPLKSHTRPLRSVRYVFVEDTQVSWDEIVCGDDDRDCERKSSERLRNWWKKPAGKYVAYPLDGDNIYFKWW